MPAKKKPVKKKAVAKKKVPAKKAAQKPSKARSPKKGAAPQAKPRMAVRAKATAPEAVPVAVPEPLPPPDPNLLGTGSVSLVGPGRIRWECWRADGGVEVRFQPSGVRPDTRRLSLSLEFDDRPSGSSFGKLDGRFVHWQFMPQPGWERQGFTLAVEGVDHAPEIS